MKLPADKAKEVDALKLDPRRRRMLESVLADHPTLTVAEAHEMLVAFDGA